MCVCVIYKCAMCSNYLLNKLVVQNFMICTIIPIRNRNECRGITIGVVQFHTESIDVI